MIAGILLGEYIVVEGERPLDEELGKAKKSVEEEKKKMKEEKNNQQMLTKVTEDNDEKNENNNEEKISYESESLETVISEENTVTDSEAPFIMGGDSNE